jgi:hypothetical protein
MLLKRIILLSLIISFININTSLAYDIGNEVNEKEYPSADAVLPKQNDKADFVIEGSVEKNIDMT